MNDEISQGAGEDLVDLTPEELRTAMREYLDKGPDFIKFGGTAHFARPAFIGFSPEAQKVLVDEAHARQRRPRPTRPRPTDCACRSRPGSIYPAPELLAIASCPSLVRTIVERQIVCSMLVNTITGEAWTASTSRTARRR